MSRKATHRTVPRIQWTPEQEQTLRDRYPHERTEDIARDLGIPVVKVYAKASWFGLKKTEAFMASPASGRTNGRQGIGSHFVKGQPSWNKGKSYQPGGRCKETQFKKGHKVNSEHLLGALRINADGYLERKTSMTHPVPARRWTAVHRLVWIEANGPIPDGHIVVFKPGARTTNADEITIDKVELITRAENMNRNTYHNYPKDIARVIHLRGALTRQINKKEKHNKQ